MQIKSKTDQSKTGNGKLRLLRITESKNSAPSAIRGDDVKMTFNVETESLRAPKTCEEALDFSGWRYAIDRIEAGRRRSGHIKKVVEAECKMISSDTWFERRVDKDLFVGSDLENAAAPVADVKITVMIEGDTGSDTHPFRIQLCTSRAID